MIKCVCVCMYLCMYVCMYVRTYVCLYVCTYVRTYVRMYVFMYIYIYIVRTFRYVPTTEVFIWLGKKEGINPNLNFLASERGTPRH
jgi:hypothetical protein